MKKLFKKLPFLLLIAALALSLGACSSISEKEINEYGKLISDVIDIVSEVSDAGEAADKDISVQTDTTDVPAPEAETEPEDTDAPSDDGEPVIAEDGVYSSKEDVALYIHTYGCLPSNFVTKNEARSKGWSGGSLEKYFPGCSIGGDRFGNNEGLLPTAKGRQYYECDIDTAGASSRGAKRIVYSSDGLIYYTEDHYESFTLLYGEE